MVGRLTFVQADVVGVVEGQESAKLNGEEREKQRSRVRLQVFHDLSEEETLRIIDSRAPRIGARNIVDTRERLVDREELVKAADRARRPLESQH